MSLDIDFRPSGDTGLTVQFEHADERGLSQRVVRLGTAVDKAGIPGVIEAVPTYRSLLIHYDPMSTSQAVLVDSLKALIGSLDDADRDEGTAWRLPVCFDGADNAPDLASVADWAGLSTDEVVDAITAKPLYVYMIGFAPGQPYLGDLPDRLAIPRRENPVARIPAGSVVVATGKAVIYPFDNPTGWHVVGRTPARLFDAGRIPPALLTAGDTVSFYRVTAGQYEAIEKELSAGDPSALRASAT